MDAFIGELMLAILHHRDFQSLEAAWRSAYLLARRIETSAELKLFLIYISKAELLADLNAVANLRDTALYKILVEETWKHREGNSGR